MFGEDVATLPLRVAVPEVHESCFGMAMQECEVNTMLAVEVPHSIVDAGADDGDCGLVITILFKPHLAAPLKKLQEVKHWQRLAS